MATKILVIEDERVTRTSLLDFLTAEGFDTLSAANGHMGIQLAREYLPALIICDILMPELDGYDVLTTLQKDVKTAAIPFIFLTVTANEAGFRQSMAMGADDYLSKPVTSEALRHAIAAQLGKKEEHGGLTSTMKPQHPVTVAKKAQELQELLYAKEQLLQVLCQKSQQHLTKMSQSLQTLEQGYPSEVGAPHSLQALKTELASQLALVNEASVLQNVLAPENALMLLEQFNLLDRDQGLDSHQT